MALFNEPTQASLDVGETNRQGQANANAIANYMSQMIAADASHDLANAQLIDQLGPFLGKFNQLREHRRKRMDARAEAKDYENDEINEKFKVVQQPIINQGEKANNALEAQTLTAAKTNLAPGGSLELARVLSQVSTHDNTSVEMKHRNDLYPEFLVIGGSQVELTRQDGTTFTRDSAKTIPEYKAAQRAIRAIWLNDIRDSTTLTERQRYMYDSMKAAEQVHTTKWAQAHNTAITKATNDKLDEDLTTIIKTGNFPTDKGDLTSNSFTDYIEKVRGWHGGTNDEGVPIGNLGIAKAKVFEKFTKAATRGNVSLEDVDKIGNSYFEAKDGSRQQVKKYFKKEYNELLKAATNYKKDEVDTKNQKIETQITDWGLELEQKWAEQGTPVTNDQLEKAIDDFKSRPEWRGRKLPKNIAGWYTKQDEDDDEIKRRIIDKAANLIPIDISELGGISDSNTKLQLVQQLKVANLSALDDSQRNTRDETIKARVSKKLKQFDALPGKESEEWKNSVRGATAAFNAAYTEAIAKNPNNRAGAMTAAFDVVDKGIKDGTWEKMERVALDNTVSNQMSKTYDAIGKNPSIINEARLPAVTDNDISQGLKAIAGEEQYPPIFYDLSRRLSKPGRRPITPYEVALAQVNQTLISKDLKPLDPKSPKVDDDMRAALKPVEVVTVNKGPAGLNKVIKENSENLSWFLDNVKDGAAMRNGGHDYILSPEGGDAHLEKPLTEHTIDEVITLLQTGHGNLTAYAMSPVQFLNAFKASPLELTDVLTAENQDTLAAYVAIANLKHRNDLTGFYGSNELSDLSQDDRKRMSALAGTVESDWNTIENLVSSELY